MNKLKIMGLKTIGAVDYYASSLRNNSFLAVAMSVAMGCLFTLMSAGFTAVVKEINLKDAADDLENVTTRQDGFVYGFPSSCDMDYDYYLIAKDNEGEWSLSAGDNLSIVDVLPVDEQQDQYDDVKNCVAHMVDWAKNDKFSFAEEFKYAGNVTYSAPIIIHDINSDENTLRIDVIDGVPFGETSKMRLDKIVAAHDDYEEEGDNTAIYKGEFSKAATGFIEYMDDHQDDEIYFKGEQIKNANRHPVYEYDSMTFKDILWFGGGSLSLSFLFVAGPMTSYRGSAYDARAEKRTARIGELNALSGRDKPLM